MKSTENPYWLQFLPAPVRERLSGRFNLHAIIHNSGWLLFDKLVRVLLVLLVSVWVARYLGPSQFGELSYILVYISFFQVLTSLGMDGIVVREIAQDKLQASQILGTAFALRLLAGVLCWIVAVGSMALINGWNDRSVWLIALAGSTLVFQSADTIDLWFQSQSQSKRTVVAKLVALVLSNSIRVVLIFTKAPLIAFAVSTALDMLLAAIAMLFAYRSFPCIEKWNRTKLQGKRLIYESWPFMAAGFMNMIQARIEFILIKSMLGAEALGQYAAALRFMELIDVAGMVVAMSIFPKLASLPLYKINTAIRKTYFIMFLIYFMSLPCIVIIWWFIGYIYGHEYSVAKDIFLFMALRPLLTFIGITRGMSININRKNIYSFYCSLVGVLTSLLTGFMLIPKFGLVGAVASATLSYIFSNLVIDFVFFKENIKNIIGCYK